MRLGREMASRKEIGEKIKLARKTLGYTQKTVSERSGVNKTTISEIENGHFTGSFDLFEKVMNCMELQFEVVPKKHNFRTGMKLNFYLKKMMNKMNAYSLLIEHKNFAEILC